MSTRFTLVALSAVTLALLTTARARAQERPTPSPNLAVADPSIVASTLSMVPLQLGHAAPASLGVDPGASTVLVGFTPLVATWHGVEIAASGGAMRDASGIGATWARATASRDLGALRVTTTLHATHWLASGRDPVDAMAAVGATYRVHGPLRAGVEYVAQDVEAGLDDDGDGGVRHFIGPIVAIDLPRRFALVAGPAVSLMPTLAPGQASIVSRLGVSYVF